MAKHAKKSDEQKAIDKLLKQATSAISTYPPPVAKCRVDGYLLRTVCQLAQERLDTKYLCECNAVGDFCVGCKDIHHKCEMLEGGSNEQERTE